MKHSMLACLHVTLGKMNLVWYLIRFNFLVWFFIYQQGLELGKS